MSKKVAVLGSSGGNLYSMGGKDPEKLLGELLRQAASAGISIAAAQFVAAESTMDNVRNDVPASLYEFREGGFAVMSSGTLDEVNRAAEKLDKEIASLIEKGEIDGLILMSCDPDRTNSRAITAAAKIKIPVAGTGGASIAKVQAMGVNVISASGTTGTTNRTRAVAYISSLSKYWGLKYSPVIGTTEGGTQDLDENVFKRINLRGIMMGAMPGFISMALILALSKIPGLGGLEEVFNVIIGALPVIVAVLAARQVSGLDEVGIVAGIVAGALSVDGGIIGGILGGLLAGIFAFYMIKFCFKRNFPATTANIVAGGLSGLAAGGIVYFFIAPVAAFMGDGVRGLIENAIEFSPIIAGGIAGLLIWPAIIGGVYHAAILPIVLLEMEATGNSFLGAIDMTGLVMVSAGITLANVVAPREKSEAAVALPGFLINVFFGTFVEAAYPFMFSDKKVFASALIAGLVSGAAVGVFNVRGTAYVPSVVAPFMSNQPLGFAICMLIAFTVAFVLTFAVNKLSKKKEA